MTDLGFTLEAVDSSIVDGYRPAWAVYYRSSDCKLQVCWSAREGGIEFMLAPLDAPNSLGLTGSSDGWRYLLTLSRSGDDLPTPPVDADKESWWNWRKALLSAHIDEARATLAAWATGRGGWQCP
ncbi:hypothetical protein [Mycolicibacterium goodii]|uniref:hypothetical protein n=1 Tax=Mycolicibacterium goodii TaxID=134601 RepID=UPI0012FF9EAE